MKARIAVALIALCFTNVTTAQYVELPEVLGHQIQQACMDRFRLRLYISAASEKRQMLYNYCVSEAMTSSKIRDAMHAVSAADLARFLASHAVRGQGDTAIRLVSAREALSKEIDESFVRQLIQDEKSDNFSEAERDRVSKAYRIAPHAAEAFFDALEEHKQAKAYTTMTKNTINEFLSAPWPPYASLNAEARSKYQEQSDSKQQTFKKSELGSVFEKQAESFEEFRSQWPETQEAQNALSAERKELTRRARIIKLLAADIVREAITDLEDP